MDGAAVVPFDAAERSNEEDMSDTESLEDDKYWDDDVHLSEDENESENNLMDMDGAAVVPFDAAEEAPRNSKSGRRSSKYDFGEEDWDVGNTIAEGENQPVEKSSEDHDTNEVTPNHERVEETPKRKSERSSSERRPSERRTSQRRPSEKRKSEMSSSEK